MTTQRGDAAIHHLRAYFAVLHGLQGSKAHGHIRQNFPSKRAIRGVLHTLEYPKAYLQTRHLLDLYSHGGLDVYQRKLL